MYAAVLATSIAVPLTSLHISKTFFSSFNSKSILVPGLFPIKLVSLIVHYQSVLPLGTVEPVKRLVVCERTLSGHFYFLGYHKESSRRHSLQFQNFQFKEHTTQLNIK